MDTKANYIEEKVTELHSFIIDGYDKARSEGNSLLNWYFAIIASTVGGIGFLLFLDYGKVSFLVPSINYRFIGGVFIFALVVTLVFLIQNACRLLTNLATKKIYPLGATAEQMKNTKELSIDEVRLFYAEMVDELIAENRKTLETTNQLLDWARSKLAEAPIVLGLSLVTGFIFLVIFRYLLLVGCGCL